VSDKSARILVRVRLVENEVIPVAISRTRRHPCDDPRAEVGEDVPVGVCVGVVECQLNALRRRALVAPQYATQRIAPKLTH